MSDKKNKTSFWDVIITVTVIAVLAHTLLWFWCLASNPTPELSGISYTAVNGNIEIIYFIGIDSLLSEYGNVNATIFINGEEIKTETYRIHDDSIYEFSIMLPDNDGHYNLRLELVSFYRLNNWYGSIRREVY